MKGIQFGTLPQYCFSAYRRFEEGEYHVSRTCADDVIVIVIDGVLSFTENGVRKRVFGGEYYIQERGIYQSADEESKSPHYYYIHTHLDMEDSDVPPYLPLRGSFNSILLMPYIEKLEAAKSNPKDVIGITSAFLGILDALSKGNSTRSRIATEIADYLSAHLSEKITLDMLCKKYGYCKNYLNEVFKKEFGCTMHDHLISLRVLAAKGLLISSCLSIDEVAVKCGFDTYVNMYKAFVGREGISPGEYRKRTVLQS